MQAVSLFLPAPTGLSGCLFGGIFRDTRGVTLTDAERFNHFPASPLVSASYVISGALELVSEAGPTPVAPFSVIAPQDSPVTSWSAGPVAVVSIGIYPDAWAKLEQSGQAQAVAEAAKAAFEGLEAGKADAAWAQFCDDLSGPWQAARAKGGLADWAGPARLSDWARSVAVRSAMAGPGRSLRAFERRLRRWSQQSQRSLKFFADFEGLHELSVTNADSDLAGLANEAGYSDQSHMGRAVRRATGFSPAQLNQHIKDDEAFWCYRLLGERF